jgi:putative membrane protein
MNERALRAGIAGVSAAVFGFLLWLIYGREGSGAHGGAESALPALNAAFNFLAACMLVLGYRAIRAGRRELHMKLMLSALACSAMFLTGYIVHHWSAGDTPFRGQGLIRPVYFAMLITHVLATMVALPMILLTLARASAGRFEEHRRVARWTLPVWLYVSVTGVLIFAFLRIWA